VLTRADPNVAAVSNTCIHGMLAARDLASSALSAQNSLNENLLLHERLASAHLKIADLNGHMALDKQTIVTLADFASPGQSALIPDG
jgi:hypothetical protein